MILAKKISNLMHGFKSSILEKLPSKRNENANKKIVITHPRVRQIQDLCRKGDFLKNPLRELIFFCCSFELFGALYMYISGFMQEKVQKGDFLKKPSQEMKNYFCFRIVWIPQTPGRVNFKQLVFLPSKNLYRQCALMSLKRTCH